MSMSQEEIFAVNLERNREWFRRTEARAAELVAAGEYPDMESARMPASHQIEAERQIEGNAARQDAPAEFAPPASGTFGDYLLRNAQSGVINFGLRASVRMDGRVHIAVESLGSGEFIDLVVDGNALSPLR